MAHDVYKFDYDKWVLVDPTLLISGDVISAGNITAVFSHLEGDNSKRLHCNPLPDSSIHVMLGADHDFTTQAMDCVGSDVTRFDDGTCQITSFSNGCRYVYSPRLLPTQLEIFCKTNISFYKAFYDENFTNVEKGNLLPFSPFWIDS